MNTNRLFLTVCSGRTERLATNESLDTIHLLCTKLFETKHFEPQNEQQKWKFSEKATI